MTLHYTDVPMDYSDDATTLETTLELVYPPSGRRTEVSFDNLHSAVTFMAQNQLWPYGERLDKRLEILIPEGERELRGTEGTAIDGLTGQALFDAYRAQQGSLRLIIELEASSEAMIDEFDAIDWS